MAFVNYYRKHIKNFARLCVPLNNLTRKNIDFDWTPECETAFQELKENFMKPPVLDYPDFSESNVFKLHTDASGYGIGAVLSNNNDRPIAFASQMLNKAEQNYSTIEKELLAMVWAIRHFRTYLYGRKFELYTDHRPLVYLFTLTDPSSRLTKFRLAREEYNFIVTYKKGCENVVADALLRISTSELEDMYKKLTNETFITTRMQTHNKQAEPSKHKEVATGQRASCGKTVQMEIQNNNFKENATWIPDKEKIIIKPTKSLVSFRRTMNSIGLICKRNNVVELYMNMNKQGAHQFHHFITKNDLIKGIPHIIRISNKVEFIEDKATIKLILNDYHLRPTAGHAGIKRTLNIIKQKYFWKGMKQDVTDFIKSCYQCQKYKAINNEKTPMTVTTTAGTAFEKKNLDLVGPLIPSEGFEYILATQRELTLLLHR